MNGSKLGRPPKKRQVYLEALEPERLASAKRGSYEPNKIEGYFGVCKRLYGLDVVVKRLKLTCEMDIYVSILTRNLFKRLKTYYWHV